MAKSEEIDYTRLCDAIQRSRRALEFFRTEHRDAVKEYAGAHYSEEGIGKKVPVNLLAMYVSIVGRSLIAKNPRVMLSTFDRSLKPTVTAMEAWANKEMERMGLDNTLRRVVVNALFSIGIAKVAIATPAESAGAAWSLKAGEPFVESVDLDDFVFSINARNFEQCSFIGHRYRVPLQAVKDSKIYNKSRKDLSASEDPRHNLEGDERLNVLGRGFESQTEEFEDMVDLWEIYLPRHKLVVTLADQYLLGPTLGKDGKAEPLRVQRWLGPDRGPYYVLAFNIVPGNPMPKAPIQDLRDLNNAANTAYRKAQRMSERTKSITAVSMQDAEDARRCNEANDGDTVALTRPEALKPMDFNPGPLQSVQLMANEWKQLFSWAAGNLDMMGGLNADSPTLGQDRMLEKNSSRTVGDMQDTTISYTADVVKGLCWYWYHDPFKVMKSKHSIDGVKGVEITRQVTPQDRQKGAFEDLDIEVDPYSMQRQTPQQRMALLDQVMTQVYVPLSPQLQSQGITADFHTYLQLKAKYGDMPDLQDIVTIQEPPQQVTTQGGAPEAGAPAGPPPDRHYIRENVPMRTDKGHQQDMQARLMGQSLGGNPNNTRNGQMNGAPR